jgi:YesN/AraC family two-component response regulator
MNAIPIRYINGAQKEPDFPEHFSIRHVGDLLAGKDMVQELHRHDFFYILVLEKGAGQHEIDFTSYQVADQSVFLMRPGQVHQIVLKARSTGYLIGFKADFFYADERVSRNILRNASSVNFYQLQAKGFQKIFSTMTAVLHEYTDRQEGYFDVIRASLGILFIELIRQQDKRVPKNINPYSQERYEKFLEFLEQHVSSHKEVSGYADMLNLSPYQLNAITKATAGKTCSAIINEYIILEAKRFLLATHHQVNQVSYEMGYEDVSYFIRFFKKHTGYTPEVFRNNFR